jgi:hypothetical protein
MVLPSQDLAEQYIEDIHTLSTLQVCKGKCFLLTSASF